MHTYADLEIRILDRQPQGYPVEMTLNSEQQFPRGYLQPNFIPWKSGISAQDDGERLLSCLLEDEKLRSAWAEVRGQYPQRRIRLRLDAAAPELHAVPWELLREAGEGAALDLAAGTATPFSRYMAGRWQPGSPVLKRPIRVLAVISNPDGLDQWEGLGEVKVQDEWDILQAAAGNDKNIELVLMPQPCSLSALEAALREGYHVLHFVGHGSFRESDGTAVLFMADDSNAVSRVSDQEIADMLARQLADVEGDADAKLRLVYLSSCQTASRSPADAFRGLAPRLVAAGVPAVIAMQDLVPVVTAQQFTATFYSRLLAHGQVDLAANEARSAVMSARLPGASIPVLFSRLRSSQLLGQRGHISSGRDDLFWPFLLDAIEAGQVTAFLGPHLLEGLLPDQKTCAEALAKRFEYPLPESDALVRVAQFIAVNARLNPKGTLGSAYMGYLKRSLFSFLDLRPTEEQKKQYKDASLTDTIAGLNWAERVLELHENEVHHQLADLKLPLYLTTNPDNFMAAALEHSGVKPRRLGLRWEHPTAGSPQYVLTPPPSRDDPVVLHLNGHDGDKEQLHNMVLSEDDYMRHLLRLARDQQACLPMNVLSMLSEHSFLFLGFSLDDWEFRVILHGLLPELATSASNRKRHVGVQLELTGETGQEKAMAYLNDYMGQYNIDIYWGTTQQFVNDLHNRWQKNAEVGDDDWEF